MSLRVRFSSRVVIAGGTKVPTRQSSDTIGQPQHRSGLGSFTTAPFLGAICMGPETIVPLRGLTAALVGLGLGRWGGDEEAVPHRSRSYSPPTHSESPSQTFGGRRRRVMRKRRPRLVRQGRPQGLCHRIRMAQASRLQLFQERIKEPRNCCQGNDS